MLFRSLELVTKQFLDQAPELPPKNPGIYSDMNYDSTSSESFETQTSSLHEINNNPLPTIPNNPPNTNSNSERESTTIAESPIKLEQKSTRERPRILRRGRSGDLRYIPERSAAFAERQDQVANLIAKFELMQRN